MSSVYFQDDIMSDFFKAGMPSEYTMYDRITFSSLAI